MNREEFISSMYTKIKEINIINIIGKYVNLEKKGNDYSGRCPFHGDKNLGNFIVTPSKGIYKCFSCGAGGDSIDFIKEYTGMSSLKAAADIAIKEGIIDQVQLSRYIENKITNNVINELKNEVKVNLGYKRRDYSNILLPKVDTGTRDKVFNIMLDNISLSDIHRKQLNEERGLSNKRIEDSKYKSYPTKQELKKVLIALEKKFEDIDEVLEDIPGFYQQKVDKNWEWKIPSNIGILIPIRDVEGNIVGLQIRRDKEENYKGRYVWFSSSSQGFNNIYRFGTSSGSPLDILYTKEKPNNILVITEGRFKSELVSNLFGSTCISVQGIGNWKNINNFIIEAQEEVKGRFNDFTSFGKIYIAFDSDTNTKKQVYKQLKKMSDNIKEEVSDKDIYYLNWDTDYKGIDDYILSKKIDGEGYQDLFSIIRKEELDEKMIMKEW